MMDQNKNIELCIDNIIEEHPEIFKKFESFYTYDNHKVPRVTKIIKRCIHSEGLMQWANYIGFKHQSYTKILSHAADIGTQCHAKINSFFETKNKQPVQIMEEARYAYNSFIRWYNEIQDIAVVKPIAHERSLVCKYFGGTLDGLYSINNNIYIIDYKTSNHIDFDYMLQIAAYIYMLENCEKINVDGGIILQLSKSSVDYNEYALDFHNPDHKSFIEDCKTAFLSMTLWYYNLFIVETNYSSLNLGGK